MPTIYCHCHSWLTSQIPSAVFQLLFWRLGPARGIFAGLGGYSRVFTVISRAFMLFPTHSPAVGSRHFVKLVTSTSPLFCFALLWHFYFALLCVRFKHLAGQKRISGKECWCHMTPGKEIREGKLLPYGTALLSANLNSSNLPANAIADIKSH